MRKITTCLWFESQAEEAATLYTSLIAGSRILEVQRFGEAGPGTPGTAMAVTFELAGQQFMALNGRPGSAFTEAASVYVACESQAEIDELWARLTADGGEEGQCGWLKDRWGVSWQIVPRQLSELLGHADPVAAQGAMKAMLGMRKLDLAALYEAAGL
ncbi:putative 3-demethylubiquinone-9 3-methyltransferase (glyoxalase superfamily) [Nonomuraea fuscirosea]|uniref:Putative 3-demethylubiquinone-9 3-methyltransferase (Glyoxalase superfamily) n=1 Tax=Nonomuraea fuscirosea TaxID=1291556 RepID=A0A2T0N1T7_9ACTN|nr:VOC family protein [Nonomuraea fuscirosea]PRX65943.1 putative 3-demethylubiquinone-9 3-methyltransferase (glyoxalase superfamily) [Nonomuraea fuscirosea]